MEPVFVDASVFLRFLVRDVEELYAEAKGLFEQAERGRLKLETTELVLAEVARELEQRYRMSRDGTREVLEAIINTRNLRVTHHDVARRAVEIYGEGAMNFTEAFNIAWLAAKGRRRVATFIPGPYRGREGVEVL